MGDFYERKRKAFLVTHWQGFVAEVQLRREVRWPFHELAAFEFNKKKYWFFRGNTRKNRNLKKFLIFFKKVLTKQKCCGNMYRLSRKKGFKKLVFFGVKTGRRGEIQHLENWTIQPDICRKTYIIPERSNKSGLVRLTLTTIPVHESERNLFRIIN